MRGKTISWRFLTVGSTVLLYLLLMAIVSGCKKETDEVNGKQKTQDVVSEELVDGLAFDLKEISDSDVAWPGRSLPRALKFPGKIRKGEIKIDGTEYEVFLSPHPRTDLCLFPKSSPLDYPRWSGANRLNATHAIGGKYYSFAATAKGDKIIVRPYEGQLGTFEVGAGGRNIQEMAMQGSLRSEDTAVAIGGEVERGWPKPSKSCRLPVGDYLPAMVTVTLGRLRISLSENYHADGQPRGRDFRNCIFGIKIREDKPYVFDFSNKPEVMFASPAKDHHVKLGQELTVKAILIDPELDIMIRRLDDTTRKQKKEYVSPDGEKHTYERSVSLDPKVVITRADGEKVAEGVMPFG
jgi:hypothetical protein